MINISLPLKVSFINIKKKGIMNYKEEYEKLLDKVIKQRAYVKQYQHERQEYRLLAAAKQRAKSSNLEFALELEDINIPEYCPYLNCEITNIFGEGRVWSNASIDRIDSSKGYIKGNIQVISDLANRMKQNASVEQLIAFANGILKLYA